MSQTSSQRDAAHNEGLVPGFSIRPSEGKWVSFGPGVEMQVLRVSAETGHWAGLFRCAAGSVVPRHEHLGAAEYLVLDGKVEVRGGPDEGGLISLAGDYVYEPNGIIHNENVFVEDSLVYFANQAPLKFMDENDNITFICDWKTIRDMAAA